MNRPEGRDFLPLARLVASFVVTGLIAFVVVIDRIAPMFADEYLALSDTALGLLLGALFALVGIQGVDLLHKK